MNEHEPIDGPPAERSDQTDGLWTDDAIDRHGGDRAGYQRSLLAQDRLYVEMADRISQRRGLANSSFLTLDTALASAVGLTWDRNPTLGH